MKPNQSLFDITANALKGLEAVLDDYKPDLIFVQGDTTTVFAGALAGFYKKKSKLHILKLDCVVATNKAHSPKK